jgi:hypothetical protein
MRPRAFESPSIDSSQRASLSEVPEKISNVGSLIDTLTLLRGRWLLLARRPAVLKSGESSRIFISWNTQANPAQPHRPRLFVLPIGLE